MERKAARTARSPIFQVALEQLVPREKRIIVDPVAYPLLPAGFKSVVDLCQVEILRKTLLNLVDRQAPGIHGGILCRKRYIEDKLRAALEADVHQFVILGAGFDTYVTSSQPTGNCW